MYGFHPEELYAKDVALALRQLHMDRVVVKKSPRKRNYKQLLEKYSACWMLDLHDSRESRMRYHDGRIDPLLTLFCIKDASVREKLERFRLLYNLKKEVSLLDNVEFHRTPQCIGVELMISPNVHDSIGVLTRLLRYLHSV